MSPRLLLSAALLSLSIFAGACAEAVVDEPDVILNAGPDDVQSEADFVEVEVDPAEPAAAPIAVDQIGTACGAEDACAPGLTCVHYYGIGGALGPEMASCELPCTANNKCPADLDLTCQQLADGPGPVCL